MEPDSNQQSSTSGVRRYSLPPASKVFPSLVRMTRGSTTCLCRSSTLAPVRASSSATQPTQSMSPSSAQPDGDAGAPEAVAGQVPVARALQPFAEAAALDVVGHPVDLLVAVDHPLLERLRFAFGGGDFLVQAQEPVLLGAVQQGHVGAPAMGIAVHEGLVPEHAPVRLQLLQDVLVRVLGADACPVRNQLGELAFGVQRIEKPQAFLLAQLEILFAEGRRDVHRTGAVLGGDEVAPSGWCTACPSCRACTGKAACSGDR